MRVCVSVCVLTPYFCCRIPPKFHLQCDSDHNEVFIWLLLSYKILMLAVGLVLAFLTRNVNSAFRESKWISFAIYNFCFIGAVIIPIVILLDSDQDAKLILQSIAILVAVTGFCCLLCVPKIVSVHKHEKLSNFFTTAGHRTTTTSSGTTHKYPGRSSNNDSSDEVNTTDLKNVVATIFDDDD
jgi:7 transmembrane sweet-taste receptor of 3 GCPR